MASREEPSKHLAIADYLMNKIGTGEIGTGEKMPSIGRLVEQFGVYRSVAERALKRLENLGWLTPVHGKGYYVSGRLDKVRSTFAQGNHYRYSDKMTRLGLKPDAHLLDWCLDRPTPKEQELLHIAAEEQVYRLEILRFFGSIPISITTSTLPEKLVPGMERHLSGFYSLYGLLEKHYRFVPVRLYSVLEAKLPRANDADLLEMQESMPIIYKINLNVNPDGLPVEMDIARQRGDLTQYTIDYSGTAGNIDRQPDHRH